MNLNTIRDVQRDEILDNLVHLFINNNIRNMSSRTQTLYIPTNFNHYDSPADRLRRIMRACESAAEAARQRLITLDENPDETMGDTDSEAGEPMDEDE